MKRNKPTPSLKKISLLALFLLIGQSFTLLPSYASATQSSELFDAIERNDVIKVKTLLDAGVDLEAINKEGMDPLMLAAHHNHVEIFQILLDTHRNNRKIWVKILSWLGMCRTNINCNEINIFRRACWKGHKEIAQILLNDDPNIIEKRNDCYETILMVASALGHKELVEFLLKLGANINAKDTLGKTALIHAVCSGKEDIVHILLNHGANINDQDSRGNSALIHAISYVVAITNDSHIAIIQTLINAGADKELKNHRGETALSIAEEELKRFVCVHMKAYIEAYEKVIALLTK